MAIANPTMAIISADLEAYGHPNKEVINHFEAIVVPENIYHANLQSTREFIAEGKKVWLNEG
jgi:beta-lactamase superfamily II metal-dependent hydrolase